MEPHRLLAFHEVELCPHGHPLDVWLLPTLTGATSDRLLECPACGTLFVVSTTRQHPAAQLAHVEHDDRTCPSCGGPSVDLRPYPQLPECALCAERVRTWMSSGPDLPASAAAVLRCWAIRPADIDVRVRDVRGVSIRASSPARTTPARRAPAPAN
jgi:hypothetical protein